MLLTSILPALFACVLGADESVVDLASNSNITLPFIGIRQPQSILHGNVVIQARSTFTFSKSERNVVVYHLAPNTAFTLSHPTVPKPQSVFLGGVAIREGSISKLCKIGEACYQSLTDREYAIVEGYRNVGKGIIVAYPVDKTKSPSAIIVQKKGDAPADQSIPVGVGVNETIEMDTKLLNQVHIWYADRVQDTRLSGNIAFLLGAIMPESGYVYLAPYLNPVYKGRPNFVLTGRLGNTPIEYKFMYSNSDCSVLRLVPSDFPDLLPIVIRVAFSGAQHLKPWKLLLCLLPVIITSAMY